MDQVGILLKLKDLFKDTCGKQAISCLIQFPLIFDFLKDPVAFQKVVDKLGNNSKLWSPLNICRIASGIDPDSSQSKNYFLPEETRIEKFKTLINLQLIEKIDSIVDIYPIAENIAAQGNKNSWQEIFNYLGFEFYSFSNPNNILEAIFIVVYELSDNKDKLISELIDYSVQGSGPKLLARLLLINKSIGDLLIESLEKKSLNPSLDSFISLLKEVHFLGDRKIRFDLARKYSEVYPFDEKKLQNNGLEALADELSKLQYLKNYSALFQIIGNKEESERISRSVKEVLAIVGQKFGLKSHFEKIDNQNLGEIGLVSSHYESELLHEIKRIKNIAKTDNESAISLAREFSRKLINNHDLGGLIFHIGLGFLIEPESLVQVFIDLGLLGEAQAILKKLLKLWSQSSPLLRIAANLAHDNGDHRDAIDLYVQLDLSDSLSREEKLKFASSLEYLDQWENAFDIKESINITNDKDFSNIFLCAYYAGNSEAQKNLLAENKQWTGSSALNSLLRAIADEDTEQVNLISESLTSSDFSNTKNENVFLLVADFFHKNEKINEAIRILEDYAKNSSYNLSIINRLNSYFQEMGEVEKSRLILDIDFEHKNSSQKSVENYVNTLIQSGKIDKADQILIRFSKSWELSPKKNGLSAKILIEQGKYFEAEKILLPLVGNINCDTECKFDYCLALLKCKSTDFPFGMNLENPNKIDEIRKLVDFKNENGNIFLKMLDAELDINKRLEKYQGLLQKYSENNDPNVWRIFAGLGRTYFDLKQFDSAIINIKRAYQTVPNNQILFWLLIRCYANLRLWSDIENLLNKALIVDNSTIIKDFRKLGVFSENSEWSRFLENQVQKKPEEIIYQVLLAQSLVETDKKFEAVAIVKSFYEKLIVENENYLFCIQILVDANEIQLAERLIEIYLVNKKTPDKIDYLSCAFLYYQLGRSEKALAMMNHLKFQNPALMIFKAKLLNDLGRIDQSQNLVNHAFDNVINDSNNLNEISVLIPEVVKQIQINPALSYLMASSLAIENKDIDKAISILEKGLISYPENPEILFNLLELSFCTGRIEKLESLMDTYSHALLEINSPTLLCLLGEIALSHKEEVASARYLTNALKLAPQYPRVKALQARMVAIKGNIQEAKINFSNLVEEINSNGFENKNKLSRQLEIGSKLWLANAALELKDYKFALGVCQQEIENLGYFKPISKVLLSALSARLENEFLLREIKINKHSDPIQEEVLKNFSVILKNDSIAYRDDKKKNDLLIRCQLFLEKDPGILARAEKLEPETDNINAILFAIFTTKGQEAAEIAFNSYKTNSDHELFIAILEKDKSPEKALDHLKNINNTVTPDARYHALLAIIEKNLGNLTDAYAAISLALDQWPDEYEWQILAGELSKATGDLHASMSHYEKAQRLILKQGLDKNIEKLYLSMETEDAIPVLEKKLLQHPNKEQFMQLGKIFLKAGNYRKAVNVFETVIKQDPQDAIPYYWLSEIALNLDNPKKALENIEKAIANDGSNNHYICKKAEIVYKVNGYSQALSILDGELSKKHTNDSELLRYKIKLLSENEGNQTALRLIDSITDLQEDPRLLFEKASLEFRLGNFDESESIAEKLLNIKDIKADALAILGLITKSRGEFDRAIDFYVKSIELNPFSSEKFINLAEIYHDRKDFKLALETLEDGIRTNPGSFDLLYRSGLYSYQNGLYNEAGKRIKEAIRIKPNHRDLKELLGLLENVIAVKTKTFANQFAEKELIR